MFQSRVPLRKLGQMPETYDLKDVPIPEGYRLVRAQGVGYQIVLNNPGPDDPAPGSVELNGDDIVYTVYPSAPGAMDLFDALVRFWATKGVKLGFEDVKNENK
ncbi:hypothetical protein A2572_01780 [Candidatus Collierbacteria bacterium RIFOXYD1_FULL_40_9]|uniref:Uncharacterized protein n=1 Tax=Candidatus Collierbacteria bacterium RIFOXYD1_FULL_40_9 TaxID=1817731 RepID=A0A1F5FUY0_9BACT|nr:MAG: hypothetical protein A2572_01780 [Candidatus Collierbacteria bacterium RIFOXYD1_FULL_40_9]